VTVHKLHDSYTRCSRCDAEVGPGSRTKTVEVKDEIWMVDGAVDTMSAKAVLVFCVTCSPLFDFKRLAVGRKLTEEDLVVQEAAESAEIEAGRSGAAAALCVSPDHLTGAQIKGWLLEQEADAIFNGE
jgi:hypothetical protein